MACVLRSFWQSITLNEQHDTQLGLHPGDALARCWPGLSAVTEQRSVSRQACSKLWGWRVHIRDMPDLPRNLEVVPLPVQERHDGAEGGVQARQAVAQGDVGPDRRPVQVAVQVPDAAVRLAHAGVAGQMRLGACLAVAADPGVDQGVLQVLQAFCVWCLSDIFS